MLPVEQKLKVMSDCVELLKELPPASCSWVARQLNEAFVEEPAMCDGKPTHIPHLLESEDFQVLNTRKTDTWRAPGARL